MRSNKRAKSKKRSDVMSKSGKTASEVALDEQKADSVLDFLYQDARRVGSFLAQFDNSGHLKQIKQNESASKSASTSAEARVGAHALFAASAGKLDRTEASQGVESVERTYDPFWANARNLTCSPKLPSI